MSLEKFIKEHKEAFDLKKMSSASQAHFEQRLKDELHTDTKKHFSIPRWSIAASIIMLIGVTIILISNNNKERQLTTRLVSSMENESTSVRLQAIYDYEDNYKKEDDRLLKTLFDLLHEDGSNNVKIAAIDALLKFPNNEKMRLQLVKALESETEPLVQLKLIDAVMKLKENRAEKPLKKLIEHEQTFPEVKGNASIAMINIKNE